MAHVLLPVAPLEQDQRVRKGKRGGKQRTRSRANRVSRGDELDHGNEDSGGAFDGVSIEGVRYSGVVDDDDDDDAAAAAAAGNSVAYVKRFI